MMDRPSVSIIEDEAAHRRLLGALVRRIGVDCRTFATGWAFLDAAPIERGCILLDMCLPDTSGLAVQAELARRGCRTPVIMMSGHADAPTAVTVMKRGAMDFLVKPLNPASVIDGPFRPPAVRRAPAVRTAPAPSSPARRSAR